MIARALAAALALAGCARAAPPSAMSADYCADQFLLRLADRAQILAVSRDAAKDFSYLRREAAGLPRVRPDPEEIAGRRPEIVLRFWGGDAARMGTLGAEIVTLDYVSDFAGVKANIRRAAAALGQAARGETLVADMDRRLAALAGAPHAGVNALYVTPGGVTAGRGTMIDAIFAAAGIGNAASEAGLSGWPPLPAERVVAAPPEFIVAGFFTGASARVERWSAARHPAFASAFASTPTVHLPADVLGCPAWFSLDAAEAIADAAGRRR